MKTIFIILALLTFSCKDSYFYRDNFIKSYIEVEVKPENKYVLKGYVIYKGDTTKLIRKTDSDWFECDKIFMENDIDKIKYILTHKTK